MPHLERPNKKTSPNFFTICHLVEQLVAGTAHAGRWNCETEESFQAEFSTDISFYGNMSRWKEETHYSPRNVL